MRVAGRMSCAGGLSDGQTIWIKFIPFVWPSQVRVAGRVSCAGGLSDGQTIWIKIIPFIWPSQVRVAGRVSCAGGLSVAVHHPNWDRTYEGQRGEEESSRHLANRSIGPR